MLKISPRQKRYVVIGLSVFLLELVIITVSQRLGAGPVAAVAWAYWLGLGSSFVLQKFVTFGDRRLHHRVIARQVAIYGLLVLFNFGFTVLVTKLLQGLLPVVMIRSLALGTTTIWNYYLYKTHIFAMPSNPVY